MIRKITKLYPVCPHCGETGRSGIDHLEFGKPFGPWYCDDCGQGYRGVMCGEDTVVEKDPSGNRFANTLVLLEYPPSDKPLRFLMRGKRFGDGDMRYFYEEHSCPVNWIGQAVMISHGGDNDLHGVLRYVREAPCPELPEDPNDEDDVLIHLFPEMLGLPAPTGEPAAPLTSVDADAGQPECSTCNGLGTVDDTLGGHAYANPHCPCPDCTP